MLQCCNQRGHNIGWTVAYAATTGAAELLLLLVAVTAGCSEQTAAINQEDKLSEYQLKQGMPCIPLLFIAETFCLAQLSSSDQVSRLLLVSFQAATAVPHLVSAAGLRPTAHCLACS